VSGSPSPLKPVPNEVVDATLPFLAPQVRAIVELKRLTGMTPQEVYPRETGGADGTIERVRGDRPRLTANGRRHAQRLQMPWRFDAFIKIWRSVGSPNA
jgi:hypothetical protein